MSGTFAGRVALVTGGSRGIGRAIALELSRTHQVIATYKSNRAAAESLAAETGASIVACDVSLPADREPNYSWLVPKVTYSRPRQQREELGE